MRYFLPAKTSHIFPFTGKYLSQPLKTCRSRDNSASKGPPPKPLYFSHYMTLIFSRLIPLPGLGNWNSEAKTPCTSEIATQDSRSPCNWRFKFPVECTRNSFIILVDEESEFRLTSRHKVKFRRTPA